MDHMPPRGLEGLFDRLPDPLRALARSGVIRHYRKDTLILDEGTPGDTVYILLEGSVRAFSFHVSEREIHYDIDRVGDYFGEMSLDGGPRSASIVTLEPTICSIVTNRTVWRFLEASPAFARHLIERLIGRTRRVTQRAREVALLDVHTRLTHLLDDLATRVEEDGTRSVPERLTHGAIAGRIGSSREMVSRQLKDLKAEGFIRVCGGYITLLKKLPNRW